jgi:hypothetical protein
MSTIIPQPQASGTSPDATDALARETAHTSLITDSLAWSLERRVMALEEVAAARWRVCWWRRGFAGRSPRTGGPGRRSPISAPRRPATSGCRSAGRAPRAGRTAYGDRALLLAMLA